MKVLSVILSFLGLVWFSLFFVRDPIFVTFLLFLFSACVIFWVFPKFTLFLFFVFMLLQGVLAYVTRIGIIYHLDELGLVFIAFMLALKKFALKKPFYKSGIDIPLIILILIGLLSVFIYKIVPIPVSISGLLLFLKGFIIYYIFLNIDIGVKDIKKFKKLLYIIGIITFAYGILGVIWPKIFLLSLGIIPQGRFLIPALQSFVGHPGSFSALMGILVCFAFVDGLMKDKFKYNFLIVLFIVGIVFALRRTTLLGIMIACLFVFSSKLIKRVLENEISVKVLLIFLTVCFIFSGIIFVSYKDLTSSYLSMESPRSLLFKTGVKIAVDYFPLGSGFGTYSGGINQKFYSPLFYKYGLNNIWGLSEANTSFINDTFWPHVIAETGILGLICYLTIIFIFFRICFKSLKTFKNEEKLGFAVTTLMLLILSLVESTKGTFYEMTLWTFFYFGGIGVLQSWLIKQKIRQANKNENITN